MPVFQAYFQVSKTNSNRYCVIKVSVSSLCMHYCSMYSFPYRTHEFKSRMDVKDIAMHRNASYYSTFFALFVQHGVRVRILNHVNKQRTDVIARRHFEDLSSLMLVSSVHQSLVSRRGVITYVYIFIKWRETFLFSCAICRRAFNVDLFVLTLIYISFNFLQDS